MITRKLNEKGFTLIEVVVTLILVGITAALAGMWIVNVANGYVFAKMNADTAQKAQLAMTRLTKELSAAQSISSSGADNISFSRVDALNTTTGLFSTASVVISKSGEQLLLNGHPLTERVHTFNLNYCNHELDALPTCSGQWSATANARVIEITLTLVGANNEQSTFMKRVAPRNLW